MCVLLVGCFALPGGCKGSEVEVHAWPRPAPLARKTVDSGALPSGLKALLAEDAAGLMDNPDAASAASAGLADGSGVDSRGDRDACEALVDRACGLLGIHSQECIEARAKTPVDPTADVLASCRDAIDWFEGEIADTRKNPCRLLYHRICADVGIKTNACLEAKAAMKRYRDEEYKRGCKADLLLWEVRHLMREFASP